MFSRAVLRAAAQQPRFAARNTVRNFADNAFNKERAAVKEHAGKSAELWRKLSIYFVIPCVGLAGLNAYNLWNEHWEHEKHLPPLSERTEYPFQNIRMKNFPWGDGDKTLFWNENVNYHKQDDE
ncbi:cytochrome c oxidase, subunit VIa [Ascobolus immersus RN42]|uniref:Cytochrome c oxidase subunit n=1 Tax=Ascobolus immersus RN42 TaxID=1160509 RepID=A0A3N4IMC1_ASCIM|nr:cytochrome c oxidase, subunit VIa [Ascobolus immersus RN42]